MNIIKKIKLIKYFIELAKVTQEEYENNKYRVKDALRFFEQYIKKAKPYTEKIRIILNEG